MKIKKIDAIILLSFISIPSTVAAMISPALPDIKNYYHLNISHVNWIISVFMFGFMLGQIIYSPISNYYGRVKALQIGLFLNLIGIGLSAISVFYVSFSLLLIGRFISSLGTAAGLVCTIILVNESCSSTQAKNLFSYSIISFLVSINLGVFISGVITTYIGWKYCFALLFAYGIIMLILSRCLTETLAQGQKVKPYILEIVNGYKEAFLNRQLITFSIILTIATIISYTFTAEGPLIAQFKLGLNPSMYGTWNLINAVGMLFGSLLSARMLKQVTGIFVINLGFLLVAIGIFSLLIMILTKVYMGLWFFSTTAILFCAMGLIFPSSSFYASNAISRTANASGAMNFITMGIGTLVVSFVGYLHQDPLISLFVAVTGMTIIAFILFVLSFNKCSLESSLNDTYKNEIEKKFS